MQSLFNDFIKTIKKGKFSLQIRQFSHQMWQQNGNSTLYAPLVINLYMMNKSQILDS